MDKVNRYRGFSNIEAEARTQLEALLCQCKVTGELIPSVLQPIVLDQLRSLAQQTILAMLEGRTQEKEKHFGYEWKNALYSLEVSPQRKEPTCQILQKMPGLVDTLATPVVFKRLTIEWLASQTVGRIKAFTPYLVQEELELENWQEQCPAAYNIAHTLASTVTTALQNRSKPKGGTTPVLQENARRLAWIANMIAARKLFLLATNVTEYFDERLDSIPVKMPLTLQGAFPPKVYIRMGLKPRPVNYTPATDDQINLYKSLLVEVNGNLLKNLQEVICPWTAEQAIHQKIGANTLAYTYFNVVKTQALQPGNTYLAEEVFQALQSNINLYKLLGFHDNISPEQLACFNNQISADDELQDFLDKVPVQAAIVMSRLDVSLVQECLNLAVAHELVRSVQLWNPAAVTADRNIVIQAKSTLPHVLQDLAGYHNALTQSDYLKVQACNFYKELVRRLHQETAYNKAKLQSYYKPLAVLLLTTTDSDTGTIPTNWKVQSSYWDASAQDTLTDYQVETDRGTAIICLAPKASPNRALKHVLQLLDFTQTPTIDQENGKIQGVRISELSYKELRSSCLKPSSIARMQFYTSFSLSETLNILRGTASEPTDENIIEALRPCFILKYKDHVQGNKFYCRVKPAEMVRVKYRTPIGEMTNPCWDASQILGNLMHEDMQARYKDTKYNLILIEGEKKAAMLAQIVQDKGLPYHVISLPGVWMGITGPRKNRQLVGEIARFNMKDAQGNQRNCLIFFDNDKAFNPAVMDALLQTAITLQGQGSRVFVPNLPFGKHVKGADDFALKHCKTADGFDYTPLLTILENASLIPENPTPVKYPSEDQKRKISYWLEEAERIHDLQEAVTQLPDGADSTELRSLVMVQAPSLLGMAERDAGSLYDSLDANGRASLARLVSSKNPALQELTAACNGIPTFDIGTAKLNNFV